MSTCRHCIHISGETFGEGFCEKKITAVSLNRQACEYFNDLSQKPIGTSKSKKKLTNQNIIVMNKEQLKEFAAANRFDIRGHHFDNKPVLAEDKDGKCYKFANRKEAAKALLECGFVKKDLKENKVAGYLLYAIKGIKYPNNKGVSHRSFGFIWSFAE